MKKTSLRKILSLALACLFLAASLCSCTNKLGEPLMTLEDSYISTNMYRLWLSRVKGAYSGNNNAVWDTVDEDGRTYNEIFTGFVKQNAMKYLSAMHEFDELGLKLPEDEIKEIDTAMADMLAERADGDKDALNAILSQFGVNYDILREIYVIEAKLSYLEEHLYGENGTESVTDEMRESFYTGNYSRIKQIFFYTANKPVLDDEGKYTYDEKGNIKTRDYTEAEIAEQKKKASNVMTALTAGQDFDLIMASQNEDTAAASYPNGYYLTLSSQYMPEVIGAAFELGENEFKMVESEYGIHIVLRLPLDEKGYASEKNADFFSDFEDALRADLFTKRLAAHEDKIKIDEDLLAKYDIKNAVANTVY